MVPSTLDSMSWVAKPLPAKSTSIQPSRDQPGHRGPAAGVDDRRAAHRQHRARRGRVAARMRSATLATSSALGFSEDTSEFMNSKARRCAVALGGVDPHPVVADDDAVAGLHPVHRHGAHDGAPVVVPS